MKPYTKEWQELANKIAREFAPEIRPCAKCGYPVVRDYCCTNPECLTSDPDRTDEQERADEERILAKERAELLAIREVCNG